MSKNNTEDDTRYIIFSACSYGNIGDDTIMLGTTRYLITWHKAKDLFVFSYTSRETQQLLEKSGLTALATIRSGYFFWPAVKQEKEDADRGRHPDNQPHALYPILSFSRDHVPAVLL